jgi:hypothetical protein
MTSQQVYICPSCGSQNTRKFGSEIGLHFAGMSGLEKPIVFVFPEIMVCLACGHAEFTVPDTELGVLEKNTPVDNAATVMSTGEVSNEQSKPLPEVKPSAATADETITPKNRTKRRR